MKGPSLQRTALFSAVLHLAFFFTSLIAIRHSRDIILPSPYVVSLVQSAGSAAGNHRDSAQEGERAQSPAAEKTIQKKESVSKADEKRMEDLIAELQAKAKLKRIARVKAAIISIKGAERGAKPAERTAGSSGATAPGGGTYEDRIRQEIHDHWNWPGDIKGKSLEVIVTIKIKKDGTIPLQDLEWEKRSESRLFNKSIIQAIASASPVTPPPHEMELGVRFYP